MHIFNQFFELVAETGRPVCRALLMEYRAQMIDQGLSASTINVRLSAIRKLITEARENNLLDPVEAARILTVPGVPTQGVRLGNWLPEEAKSLLAVPDRGTLIDKRAFAILSVLVYCTLRRDELARASRCDSSRDAKAAGLSPTWWASAAACGGLCILTYSDLT